MIVRLIRLELAHFKAFKAFALDLGGRSATVHGDNGTGKTTLMDAWCWLLAGKDSAGRQDCSIKTIGYEAADHTVKALVDVDGTEVALSRTYREKWVRPRGAADAELQGHVTSYEVDGVPLKLREWEERLAELLPGQTLLLTMPNALAGLHWQKRRAILLGLTGDVTDGDVIESDSELEDLLPDLGRHNPEGLRRKAAADRKAANQALSQIPARIDEVIRQLAPLEDLNRDALRATLTAAEEEILEAVSGVDEGPIRERAALETRRRELAAMMAADARSAARERSETARQARQTIAQRQSEAQRAGEDARIARRMADAADRRAASLRAEYTKTARAWIEVPGICTCAACGDCHAVGPERIEAVRAAARQARAERLREIQGEGRSAVAEAVRYRTDAELHAETAEACRAAMAAAEAELTALDTESGPHMLVAKLAGVDAQLVALAERTPERPDTSGAETVAAQARADLARLDGAAGLRDRLDELEGERRNAATALEQADRMLYLLDRFALAQAELLEDRVNGLFDLARFRLWRPLINGGVEQCCDVLVDGVPYGAGLNRGAEVNAGLDIIRTLSRIWDHQVPVWVDNAESTTALLDTGGQTIHLVVDDEAKDLEVEIHE